jgi:hypothetical protein
VCRQISKASPLLIQISLESAFAPQAHMFPHVHSAPQPNWSFKSYATTGHAFGIFMACSGSLRTSCSGAG